MLLGGLWLQNSLSAQNRIIRSNLKNTVRYVIYDATYNTPTPYDPSLVLYVRRKCIIRPPPYLLVDLFVVDMNCVCAVKSVRNSSLKSLLYGPEQGLGLW